MATMWHGGVLDARGRTGWRKGRSMGQRRQSHDKRDESRADVVNTGRPGKEGKPRWRGTNRFGTYSSGRRWVARGVTGTPRQLGLTRSGLGGPDNQASWIREGVLWSTRSTRSTRSDAGRVRGGAVQSGRDQHPSSNWDRAQSRSGGREQAQLGAGARPRAVPVWACPMGIPCCGDGVRQAKIHVGETAAGRWVARQGDEEMEDGRLTGCGGRDLQTCLGLQRKGDVTSLWMTGFSGGWCWATEVEMTDHGKRKPSGGEENGDARDEGGLGIGGKASKI